MQGRRLGAARRCDTFTTAPPLGLLQICAAKNP